MNITDSKGNEWKPFIAGYDTDEGVRTCIVYAISSEHAELVIEDLRRTARLVGYIEEKKP
jgi:hypothetical protein